MAKNSKNGLKNWQEVDSALKQQGCIDANIAYVTSILNDLRAQRSDIEDSVVAFVEGHIADLGSNRIKTLEHGQVSLRPSTSVTVPDEDATLEYLRKNRLENCFKPAFKLVKSALKGLGVDIQKAAGVTVVTEDKVSLKIMPQSPNMMIDMR